MDFKKIENEKSVKQVPKKVTKSKDRVYNGVPVKIGKSTIYTKKDQKVLAIEPDSNITLEQILEAQEKEPNFIVGVSPPFYSVFLTIEGNIQPYVAVGDRVKYAKKIYLPTDVDIDDIFTVTKVELASIGSLSIVVAALNNGDTAVLTNLLKKV